VLGVTGRAHVSAQIRRFSPNTRSPWLRKGILMIVRTVGICLLAAVVGDGQFTTSRSVKALSRCSSLASARSSTTGTTQSRQTIAAYRSTLVNNHVLGLTVSTHLDNPQEILGLKVIMEQLE